MAQTSVQRHSLNKDLLFVSQSFYPSIGGVSTQLLNLFHHLLALDYNIHIVHFDAPLLVDNLAAYCPGVVQHVVRRDNIPQTALRGYSVFKEVIYQHLHGLRGFDYAAVDHVSGYDDFIHVSALFLQTTNAVIHRHNIDVVTVQDYQLIECLKAGRLNVKKVFNLQAPLLPGRSVAFLDWFTSYLRRADRFVVSIPAYRRVALRISMPDNKIRVIPPLVDPVFQERLLNSNATRGIRLDIPKDRFIISCIQRFDAKSGHEQLIKAFADVVKRHPTTHLLLVGGPSFTDSISDVRRQYFSMIQTLVQELSLDRNVSFLGALDYPLVSRVYAASNIVCMLSKMESFGMAVTEAMHHGCPVVVTDVGGLAHQVVNGVNGYKVPVGDVEQTARVINSLIENPGHCASLAQRARGLFNRYFAPEVCIQKYEALYMGL